VAVDHASDAIVRIRLRNGDGQKGRQKFLEKPRLLAAIAGMLTV
jgi:hypothetical protein